MGLNIKSEKVERLARELAKETGLTLTGAIEQAIQTELQRLRQNDDFAVRKARIREVIRRSGPTPPGLTSDHSDFYDEDGLPA